jgi:hypothetical protein
MFVHPESRGKNIFANIGRIRILGKNYRFQLYSETGRYPEAIVLYKKNGYP